MAYEYSLNVRIFCCLEKSSICVGVTDLFTESAFRFFIYEQILKFRNRNVKKSKPRQTLKLWFLTLISEPFNLIPTDTPLTIHIVSAPNALRVKEP